MKLSKIGLAIFFTVTILFSFNCKKDEGVSVKNQITYGEKSFEIKNAKVEFRGKSYENPSSYRIYIELYRGGDNSIDFNLFSSTENEIAPGIYKADNYPDNTENPLTYGYASLCWDYFGKDGELTYPQNGTVEISKTGDIYEIKIECTNDLGKKIQGYYKGKLEN